MITIELLEERLYEQSKHGLRPSSRKIAARDNQALISELAAVTAYLPQDASILERIYSVKHGLTSRPCCQTCGGPLHSRALSRFKISEGYTKFCSPRCVRGNPAVQAKQVATCLAKYGVSSVLRAEAVRDKIKQTNLERHGVESTLQATHVAAARAAGLKAYHNDDRRMRLAALKRIGQREYPDYKVELDEQLFLSDLTMRFTHSCGRVFEARLLNGQAPRCPSCDPQRSNITAPHKSIVKLLEPYCGLGLVQNSRSMLKPSRKELDIYVPSARLGIEINGLYWHSFFAEERALIQLTRDYHLEKTRLAEANEIQLIHIWEHEANDPRMHDILLSKLGATVKIGARKLETRLISYKQAQEFLLKNHLQGSVVSSYQVGLFRADELLAVMTLGKPRFSKDADWELLRLCSKLGITVVGGASKMLARFVKDVAPSSILSYAERRLSSGNVYKALGFALMRRTSPGYFYWKTDNGSIRIVSRYMAQKHKLPKLLGDSFNVELTEQQNMLKQGYGLVYDCGQLVFIKQFG